MQSPYYRVTDNELKGLGGWLILVGIGVVLGPIGVVFENIPAYQLLIEDGVLARLMGTAPLLHGVIVAEAVIQLIYFLVLLWTIWLFFSRHWLFPRVYISTLVFSVLFVLLDNLALSYVAPAIVNWNGETMSVIVRALIACGIWIPYLLKSRRVRVTFVERRKGK